MTCSIIGIYYRLWHDTGLKERDAFRRCSQSWSKRKEKHFSCIAIYTLHHKNHVLLMNSIEDVCEMRCTSPITHFRPYIFPSLEARKCFAFSSWKSASLGKWSTQQPAAQSGPTSKLPTCQFFPRLSYKCVSYLWSACVRPRSHSWRLCRDLFQTPLPPPTPHARLPFYCSGIASLQRAMG